MKKLLLLAMSTIILLIATACSNNIPQISPSPSPTETVIDDPKLQSYDVTELMEMAIKETDKNMQVAYAAQACRAIDVEPRALTTQEYSKLKKRQSEIEIMLEALEGKSDAESRDKRVELLEENLNNIPLIFYNDILLQQ